MPTRRGRPVADEEISRLRGIEADLSAGLSQVSSGPAGDVGIGPGRFGGGPDSSGRQPSSLSAGPRGELRRLA